jgi:hypothetical protein
VMYPYQGSRGSSPVHGGGWEGGMLKNQRKDTYYSGGVLNLMSIGGARRCAPTPLSHSVGEGQGVRAKKSVRSLHSELKRCTLVRRG